MSTTTASPKGLESKWESKDISPPFLFFSFAGLFFLNLLLRVFYLRYQFVNGDEAVRALTAANLLDGGRLYVDMVTDKPPATTLFYAAVFTLFGKSMIAVHLAAAVWNFLTSIMVYLTAAHIYGRRAGLWAALFFIYFSATYLTQDMIAANTELLMALPLTASFYFYLRGSRGPASPGPALFLAGALTGVAALFKQLGIFNVGLFVLSEAFFIYRSRNDGAKKAMLKVKPEFLHLKEKDKPQRHRAAEPQGKRQKAKGKSGAAGHYSLPGVSVVKRGFAALRFYPYPGNYAPVFILMAQACKRLLLITSGILVVFGALVLWLYSTGALAAFWRYVFVMNKFYIGSLSTPLWLKFMAGRTLAYIAFNLPLWWLAAWMVKRAVTSLKSPEREERVSLELLLLIWASVSLTAIFVGGRFFGHYFIQLLPALAILAAEGSRLLTEKLQTKSSRRQAKILLFFLLVCLVIGFVRFHHRTAILAYETLTGARTKYSAKWGMTKREDEAAIIAQRVRERLGARESLYIWGYALDVYWRTGYPPASRFITPNHITGEFESASGSVDQEDEAFWAQSRRQLIEDLARTRPRIILDTTGGLGNLPYADIRQFVEENYRRDGEIGLSPARPFVVYARKGGQ